MVNVTECSSIGHVTEHAFIGARYRRLHTIAHRQQLVLRPTLWQQTFSVFVFLTTQRVRKFTKIHKNEYDWMQTFSKTTLDLQNLLSVDDSFTNAMHAASLQILNTKKPE